MNHHKRTLLFLITLLAAASLQAAQRPNILLILADDLGFSDVGCYGGEMETPNIDNLAKEGLRFSQFYNTSRCCPSRASIMTGLYPHQAGMGHMMVDRGYPGYRSDLNSNCVTIAQVLKTAGYETYMCGKWHLTHFDGPNDSEHNWPVQRGFEHFYGTIRGYGNYYDPSSLCRQNTFITPQNDPEYKPKDFYYVDAVGDNAVLYLKQHAREASDKPFFMYVAFTAAHWPMQCPEKYYKKYEGKFDTGYAPVRDARIARLKELGLIDPKWDAAPTVGDWKDVKHKKWEERCKEVFDGIVDDMDQNVGKIIGELKREGALDNTVVIYLHDNGGCAETVGRHGSQPPPPADLKPMKPDQLQDRIRPPMQTRDGRWIRTGPGVMPGPADTFIAYGRNWANVSNTPFREY
ncbi:MAG TPA: sulfatase-like hydrolase/transferase, partial [Verrucomicrobiae bacterium]|nr:sulfatase-like hydrolase/transferase [Verrucomicrobiae bacterium]